MVANNINHFDAPPGFIYRDSILLAVPSLLLLLSCVKPMVVSPLSTSSEGSLICVELILFFSWLASNLHGNMVSSDLRSWWAERELFYIEDDEDLAFLPKEPSSGFGIGSSSVSVNTEPLKANEEPKIQPVEVTTDPGGSPKPELFVIHPGSVAAQIKDRKCKSRGGSSRSHVKRKLASGSSTSRATRAKTSSSKDDAPFLTVSNDDEGLPDVFELKDVAAYHLKISAITPPA
ncbi:hypothetical protein Tco_0546657 [Tanacetum coccineum]